MLTVRALGIRGVERRFLDLVLRQRSAVFSDEPPAAVPRRRDEPCEVESRPERDKRSHQRRAESTRGSSPGDYEQLPSCQQDAALLDQLLDLGDLRGVLGWRVVILRLLVDDESHADDAKRRRQENERQTDRETKELCLIRKPIERVHDDECDRRDCRASEQEKHRVLSPACLTAGTARVVVALECLRGIAALSSQPKEHACDEERKILEPVHRDRRLLRITHVPTSTEAAISQVTMPSGIGPRRPSESPPASSGCFA